jgi:hypothetical protein
VKGDPGPYLNEDGGVWVPRTVPYLEARRLAGNERDLDDRLVYVGKVEALLIGFARECPCEEVCERRYAEDETTGDVVDSGDRECYVPAWAFGLVQR